MNRNYLGITKSGWGNGLNTFMVNLKSDEDWIETYRQLKTPKIVNDGFSMLIFNKHDFVPTEEELKSLYDYGYSILLVDSSADLCRNPNYRYFFAKGEVD